MTSVLSIKVELFLGHIWLTDSLVTINIPLDRFNSRYWNTGSEAVNALIGQVKIIGFEAVNALIGQVKIIGFVHQWP